MRLRIAAISVAFVTLIAGALPAAAAPGQYQAPRKYYLALGDSLAYGFEQAKFSVGAPAQTFDTGYVDDFAQAIHSLRPDVRVVNYGCPGETSSSYLTGCAWLATPLHDAYTSSQETAALAFLNAHPGQVSPITVDLGATTRSISSTTPATLTPLVSPRACLESSRRLEPTSREPWPTFVRPPREARSS